MKRKKLVLFIVMLFGLIFINACGGNNNETNGDKNNDGNQLNEETNNDVSPNNNIEPGEINENNQDNENNKDKEKEENESPAENPDSTNNDDKVDEQPNETDAEPSTKIVAENDAFRVFEPAPNSEVGNDFIVRGKARIFEANFHYEFEDGHFILAEGIIMASHGAPEWGDFEFTIHFDELSSDHGTLILFERSAKDGERVNELMIPVTHKK